MPPATDKVLHWCNSEARRVTTGLTETDFKPHQSVGTDNRRSCDWQCIRLPFRSKVQRVHMTLNGKCPFVYSICETTFMPDRQLILSTTATHSTLKQLYSSTHLCVCTPICTAKFDAFLTSEKFCGLCLTCLYSAGQWMSHAGVDDCTGPEL